MYIYCNQRLPRYSLFSQSLFLFYLRCTTGHFQSFTYFIRFLSHTAFTTRKCLFRSCTFRYAYTVRFQLYVNEECALSKFLMFHHLSVIYSTNTLFLPVISSALCTMLGLPNVGSGHSRDGFMSSIKRKHTSSHWMSVI